MKTTPKQARARLATYDQNRHRMLYSHLVQAFGYDGSAGTNTFGYDDYGDGLLRFPDVMPYSVTGGQSDLMRARAMIAQARLAGKDPEPEFTGDMPNIVKELRQAFFNHDYNGNDDLQEGFGQAMKEAFLDMDCLGYGGVRFGLTVDGNSGQMRATGRYIKRINTFTDPMKRSPVHARWVATWDWIEEDEAAELFGWKAAKAAMMQTHRSDRSSRREEPRSCRILEYFDTGFGDGDPTYMCWLGSTETEPVDVRKLATPAIPIAWGVNFVAPGMAEPMGSIQAMLASQEARRNVLDFFQEQLEKSAIDLYDPERISEEEYNKLVAGETRIQMQAPTLEGDGPPFIRLPAAELSQGVMAYYQIIMDEFNSQSGLMELDRANMGKTGRSATEWAIMDKRMSMNQALQAGMTAHFQRRAVIRHSQAAMTGDNHERVLSVRQHNVRVNVAEKPESSIQEYISKWPSDIKVSTQSLTADEDEVRRMATAEKLITLAQQGLLQDGTIDKRWWAEELINASGFDADQAMVREGDISGLAMGAAQSLAGMAQGQPPPVQQAQMSQMM